MHQPIAIVLARHGVDRNDYCLAPEICLMHITFPDVIVFHCLSELASPPRYFAVRSVVR